MEHELTQLKVRFYEKTSATEASKDKAKQLAMKADEQKKLNSKLEEDILKGYSSTDR